MMLDIIMMVNNRFSPADHVKGKNLIIYYFETSVIRYVVICTAVLYQLSRLTLFVARPFLFMSSFVHKLSLFSEEKIVMLFFPFMGTTTAIIVVT